MTTKFKDKYRVKSARLANWDYSSNGAYFITICTQDRAPYFGNVRNGKMMLSSIGKIADQCWRDIPNHFPFVVLDEHVVMPNHVHGILMIDNDIIAFPSDGVVVDGGMVETQNFASLRTTPPFQRPPSRRIPPSSPPNKFGPQSKNIASIIRGFKIGVKKWATMNNIVFAWQPRFYDHIIRDKNSYDRIRKYIVDNPLNWKIGNRN